MKKHNLKSAFSGRFAIIVLCVVVMAGVLLCMMNQIKKTDIYAASMNDNAATLYAAEIGHLKWSSDLNRAIQFGEAFTGSRDERACVLGKHIYSEAVKEDPTVADSLEKIEPLHKEIHQLANAALALEGRDQEGATSIYVEKIQPDIDTLLALLDDSIGKKQEYVAVAQEKLDGIVDIAVWITIGLMVVTLLACLNMFLYIKNQIGEPILAITENAKRLADGQLDLDFTNHGRNEIGELGHVLNFSVREIARYIHDIDRAMEEFSKGNFQVVPSQPFIGDFQNIELSIDTFIREISGTLSTIMDTSHQVSAGAEQISDGAQALADGATQQAGSVQELSGTLTQLSVQVEQTSSNFKEINQIIEITAKCVQEGHVKMGDMTGAMDNIIEFSNKIKKIIKTIDDIAFQTNILALNAAVEAARAGSAGKGFAVVADEVRNLAQKSADAATDITSLIENSINVVNEGAGLTRETAKVFEDIVQRSEEVTMKVNQVAMAAEKESNGIKQLVDGVDQISAVVQINSATSEESAAASQELSGQAHLLKGLVSKFRIKVGQ